MLVQRLIQSLLRIKAELQARLNLIPYEGTVEIKEIDEKKYIYIRKRIANKVKSIYVGVYSEELYIVLLKQVKDAKNIKKTIREPTILPKVQVITMDTKMGMKMDITVILVNVITIMIVMSHVIITIAIVITTINV